METLFFAFKKKSKIINIFIHRLVIFRPKRHLILVEQKPNFPITFELRIGSSCYHYTLQDVIIRGFGFVINIFESILRLTLVRAKLILAVGNLIKRMRLR